METNLTTEDMLSALYKVFMDLKGRANLNTDVPTAAALVLTVASINVLCKKYNLQNPLNNT